MSGGQLVVLDRLGREVKKYPLPSGLATLGSDPRCDIRVMLPSVCGHHATVVVHANQTVVRNVGSGVTLVNGAAVSVAALRHGDVLALGERALRWEYAAPHTRRAQHTSPGVPVVPAASRAGRGARGRRGGSGVAPAPLRSPSLQLALEMQHRASMPGNAGGKQVAIVQPQRRDTTEQNEQPARPSPPSKRARSKGSGSVSPLAHTTKAEQWIQSRKTSPRRASAPPSRAPASPAQRGPGPRRVTLAPGRRATPLRTLVLRRAQSARKQTVAKIQAPTAIDHMKQAAIMLMAGHTRKSKLPSPKTTSGRPSYVIKKPSPVRKTPRSSRGTKTPKTTPKSSVSSKTSVSPKSSVTPKTNVSSDISSVTLNSPNVTFDSASTRRSSKRGSESHTSPLPAVSLPARSPRKSALRGPRAARKTDSIKFDLSNLAQHQQDHDMAEDDHENTVSEDDLTLHYSDTSSVQSPSPRRSIHSRSGRILHALGATLSDSAPRVASPPSPASPASPRRTGRGSLIVQKALQPASYSRRSTKTMTDLSFDASVASAFHTRTLTPRDPQNLETYSIVDLVSIDSDESGRSASVYDSANSSAVAFATPRDSAGRKTRSTIDPSTLLGSSTPYVGKAPRNFSPGSRNSSRSSFKDTRKSARSSGSSRRSKSLSTPENTRRHISVNSTRVSRASKSRSRLNDSDLLLISSSDVSQVEDASPRSSRRVSRSSNFDQASPIVIRGSKSKGSPVLNRTTKSNQASPAVTRKSDQGSSVGRASRSNERSPVVSRRTKSNESSPAVGRATRSNQTSPVIISRKTKSNQSSPVLGRKSKSIRFSPASGQKTKSNQGSPVISRKTRSIQASPRSNPASPKSAQASPVLGRKTKSIVVSPALESPARGRKSSRRSGGDMTPSGSGGISTPENRHSPQEVGTPVLSIQSLLDSSQSSLASQPRRKGRPSANIKRKTIGIIRSEPRRRTGLKSKSLNFTARRGLLRLSKDSDNTDVGETTTSSEKMVTPKSAVKLVQEAVKNKHSTAKKPQSKRSIIDTLDESDIVKQLFNSPVKRKLSQSMTEFSRRQLLDDDDAPRRPTRNTIAVATRTPDQSMLDHTDAFTPEVFVSPISTPSNSPNLSGIKRLYRRNDTPENDLRDVRGVKALLKTPRARRSVRNDLTNVSGIKRVFAKSPKNRLSDVRVKEVFAASPKDDLRRVTGVKSLFQSQKKRKSPRNDLSDVRGVRGLFQRGSPADDLRRVSGVKRALQRNSPKNDLTDVRGVRNLFRREKERGDLNMSGVEELFHESSTSVRESDRTFDRLLGRPPIRAVYSKSFVKKAAPKRKTRGAKSLHASIDVTAANVEDWLERELQRRLRDARPRGSELAKLATDTVQGAEPLRPSRTRDSTVSRSGLGERKKSASELYSSHTLPIKKRSLAERSGADAERSRGSGAGAEARLPLKKRAVAHSTPVKGRARALREPDLGRVSPIATEPPSLRSELQNASPKPAPKVAKGRRATKVAVEAEKPSPRKTRAAPETKSPAKVKPSPKPSPKKTKPSPRTKKSARNAKASPEKTVTQPEVSASQSKVSSSPAPRSTRARPGRRAPAVVVAKPAPVISPKPAARARRGKQVPKSPVKESPVTQPATPKNTRATRQQEKPATPKRNTRAKVQKATVVVSKPSPQLKPRARRGQVDQTEVTEAPKARGKRASEQQKAKDEAPRRSRKTTASESTGEEAGSRSKRRKVEPPKQSPKKTRRTDAAEPKGRKTKADTKSLEVKSPEKKRGRKTQEQQPEPKRNTRKTQGKEDAKTKKTEEVKSKTETAPPARGRGRAAAAGAVQPGAKPEPASRKRKAAAGDAVPNKIAKVADAKTKKEAAKETVPKTNSRKKKTETEPSPVKPAANKKSPAASRTRKAAASPAQTPPKPTRTRAARGKAEPAVVATKPTSRSRRR